MSHAYLFSSNDEALLSEFLIQAACVIVCDSKEACLECIQCMKVLHKNHSDVFFFPRSDNKKINVEDVSNIIDESYLRPVECDNKIFILNNADKMNAQSQNKLLKTLEEPPKNVIFLLSAKNTQTILPTIKSRAKSIAIKPLSKDTIKELLTEKGAGEELADFASALSNGSYESAVKLTEPIYNTLFNEIIDIIKNIDKKNAVAYSSRLTARKEYLEDILNFSELIFSQCLKLSARPEQTKIELDLPDALKYDIIKLTARYEPAKSLEILGRINETRQKIFFNANAAAVIDSLLLGFIV